MDTARLNYTLPEELIAQTPAEERDRSRLLVVDRATGTFTQDIYRNVGNYLNHGDCMVLNNTRVIRARLYGTKPTGGAVEIFLLSERAGGTWTALVRPSARVKPGTVVELAPGVNVTVGEKLDGGMRVVDFRGADVLAVLEQHGIIPLPPYIHREEQRDSDLRRYQTVYASKPGAVAAPTAGLHLTQNVLTGLAQQGVETTTLTLHVGYGTFAPVTAEQLEAHRVPAETFEFPASAATKLNAVRSGGGRVVAVGTTSVRVLETQHDGTCFMAGAGKTDTYIFPPYAFKGVDVMQTNFHLPRSSLLALVCAFGGVDLILEAYHYAVSERFRFYSYGDAMLII